MLLDSAYIQNIKRCLINDVYNTRQYINPFIERVVHTISVSDGRVLCDNPDLATDISLCLMIIFHNDILVGTWEDFKILYTHNIVKKDCMEFFYPPEISEYAILNKMNEMYISKLQKCTSIEQATKIRDKERRKLNILKLMSFNVLDKGKKWKIKRKYAYVDHYSLEIDDNVSSWRVKKCAFGHIFVNRCTSCTQSKCYMCRFHQETYCKCGCLQEKINK